MRETKVTYKLFPMLKLTFGSYLIFILLISCKNDSSSTLPSEKNLRKAPVGMVYIPSGIYTRGGKTSQASPDEFPRNEVYVDAFFLDESEVTNREFKAFVNATGYVTIAEKPINWEALSKSLPHGTPKPSDSLLQPGSLVFKPSNTPIALDDYRQWWVWTVGANWKHPEGPNSSIEDRMDHPVVHIAYDDALSYAEWAGKRLPTETEWEWAAMGGLNDPVYPWGDLPIQEAFEKANFWQGIFPFRNTLKDGYDRTSPVKSYPPNGYGLYDMAGNVWEWCSDIYSANAYASKEGEGRSERLQDLMENQSVEQFLKEEYVIRGGSFLCSDTYCSGYRVSRRMHATRDSGFEHTGFRCAQDIE